jgi:hypothetical protein
MKETGEALLVHHAEVDRVGRGAWRLDVERLVHVDHGGQSRRRLGREQIGHRHFGEFRVGNVAVPQFPGELHRLDLEVMALRRIRHHGGNAEMREYVERDQRGEALSRRRDLEDLAPHELRRDRLHPVRFMRGHIVHRQERAHGSDGVDDVFRNLAGVEGVAAFARDEPHGLRQGGIGHALAHPRGAAVLQVVHAATLIGGKVGGVFRPVDGDARRHRPRPLPPCGWRASAHRQGSSCHVRFSSLSQASIDPGTVIAVDRARRDGLRPEAFSQSASAAIPARPLNH